LRVGIGLQIIFHFSFRNSLSTLKAGDIIQYTLKSGTSEAESISLGSGDPGGK
jgi:hypothetical protein